jgi:hypothetical protein
MKTGIAKARATLIPGLVLQGPFSIRRADVAHAAPDDYSGWLPPAQGRRLAVQDLYGWERTARDTAQLATLRQRGDPFLGLDMRLGVDQIGREIDEFTQTIAWCLERAAASANPQGERTWALFIPIVFGAGNDPALSQGHWVQSVMQNATWLLSSYETAAVAAFIGGSPGSGSDPADPQWDQWFTRLESVKKERTTWPQGCGAPPSDAVLESVDQFLLQLRVHQKKPSRLAPSVVGGLGLTFRRDNRKVYVEFRNTGSVHALLSDGVEDAEVERFQRDETGYTALIGSIKKYLHE